ncbi:hypothetical protein [Streptomyces flavofungini]|uniref:hypothetical protein n=1 Tax=Streptomyces flavofungini TaxID=68200 RepID=UPI0034DE992E
MVIPAASTEYLHVPVTAPAGTDLAGMPVVAHRAAPTESEWRTAAWSGSDARLLIGPDTDTVLAAGDYRVWINIDPSGSEDIVRPAGILTII